MGYKYDFSLCRNMMKKSKTHGYGFFLLYVNMALFVTCNPIYNP
jgi:hypothetical protein